MKAPRQFGRHILTTHKSKRLMILWFAIFALPVWVLFDSWLENKNPHMWIFMFLLYAPALYMLASYLRSRLHIYENGLIYQSLFGTKTVAFKPNMQMYITRIQGKGAMLPSGSTHPVPYPAFANYKTNCKSTIMLKN
ncbi:DUF6585 family protein [Wielerella bovis]|uniref:DUF6585 family protein n=1 Tax=Wielerella bovis TaxID=2917790 RepID=UPI0020191522|nr:DUF6585 family protein [Wielerella bovis]ULJ60630.1 hypothetical protein MIS44_01760 [Wielerella bovis]